MMWWFDSNKTKPNKTKNQAPSFLQIQVLILKACVPSTVALYKEMCGFFFFFNLLFVFLFFQKRFRKMRDIFSLGFKKFFDKIKSQKIYFSPKSWIFCLPFSWTFQSKLWVPLGYSSLFPYLFCKLPRASMLR